MTRACSICSEPYTTANCNNEYTIEHGNNAWPVTDGRCCDMCNETRVVPARLTRLSLMVRRS